MEFSSSSHPTRFISMAASSLDTTLQSNPASTASSIDNMQCHQIRDGKQYIDPRSMINFEQKMQNLGNEFERARKKLTFSTNSLQSQLNNNGSSALSPNQSSSKSLINHHSISRVLPNITSSPLPNTSLPLPSSSTSNQISSIGSVIDESLQNLKAKLYKLEHEDNIKHKKNTQHMISNNDDNVNINSYKNIKQNVVNKTWENYTTSNDEKQTVSHQDTAISLPLLSKDSLNTSFVDKYSKYMEKYHGGRYRRHSDFATHNINIQKSRDNAQNMVARIKEKSKALFETDIDYKNKKKKRRENDDGYMINNDEQQIYNKSISNFDDQLNATWKKTELQLNKIKSMNEHFKQTNQAKYTLNDKYIKKTTSNSSNTHKYKRNPTTISMNESIASSHWTLDSETSHSLHVPSLNMVNEESMEIEERSNDERMSNKSQSFYTADTYHEDRGNIGIQTETAINNEKKENEENEEEEEREKKNVINLSFNRGIQVTIPVVCTQCNKNMDTKDVAVITLENQRSIKNDDDNDDKIERKQIEYDMNEEEKQETIRYEQIYSTSATLSRSSSSSFIQQNKTEIKTTMSENDRKQLIMDLKSMDDDCHNNNNYSDCHSDGILFDEKNRKYHDRNRFAKNILNTKDNKYHRYEKHSKMGSLRSKVNDLTMSMKPNKPHKSIQNRYDEDEYLCLKRKLRIYEDKLRNIDPTLLE